MKITDLQKSLGRFSLNIDELCIESGLIHGIAGHNGCGKTVLLKLIMGIMEPDSGIIDLDGLNRMEMTMMAQRPYMLSASVYENIVYPLKLRKIKPDEDKIDRLLERTGLITQKKQYAGSLSGGERQKLSFIRAIIFSPKFIIMDETLSNLDSDSEAEIISIIKEIQSKDPVTWLIVSHMKDVREELCDVIHYMEKGRICNGPA